MKIEVKYDNGTFVAFHFGGYKDKPIIRGKVIGFKYDSIKISSPIHKKNYNNFNFVLIFNVSFFPILFIIYYIIIF